MLYTESESEEVVERDQYTEVLSVESPLQSVSTNSSQPEILDQKPKKELVELLEDWESWTAIGLPKMVSISTTKSFLLTQDTTPSEMIQESTGSLNLNINTENLEDWLQQENPEEVSELRDI